MMARKEAALPPRELPTVVIPFNDIKINLQPIPKDTRKEENKRRKHQKKH